MHILPRSLRYLPGDPTIWQLQFVPLVSVRPSFSAAAAAAAASWLFFSDSQTQDTGGADHHGAGRRLQAQDAPDRADGQDGVSSDADAERRQALQASRRGLPQPRRGVQFKVPSTEQQSVSFWPSILA